MEPENNDVLTGPYKRQAVARALAEKLGLTEIDRQSEPLITRSALLELAEKCNKRPLFLFYGDRQSSALSATNGLRDREEKPINKREKSNLILIIAALCELAPSIESSKPEKAGGQISVQIATMGASLDSGTIANKLKEIPDVLADKQANIAMMGDISSRIRDLKQAAKNPK
jgi:hypothetical protein